MRKTKTLVLIGAALTLTAAPALSGPAERAETVIGHLLNTQSAMRGVADYPFTMVHLEMARAARLVGAESGPLPENTPRPGRVSYGYGPHISLDLDGVRLHPEIGRNGHLLVSLTGMSPGVCDRVLSGALGDGPLSERFLGALLTGPDGFGRVEDWPEEAGPVRGDPVSCEDATALRLDYGRPRSH